MTIMDLSGRRFVAAAVGHRRALDRTFEQVQASGAAVVQEPADQHWGTATAHSATRPASWSASGNCADQLVRPRLTRNGVHMTGHASREIDAIIENSGDWRGESLSRLRGIVLAADPAVIEEVKWKKPSKPEGVPVWSADGIVCTGEMLKNAVRLTFPKGAQINDPDKVFNTRMDSKSVRAVDFREGEQVPEAALKALIIEAVNLNARTRKR
jgi:hypothetical protein